MAHDIFLKLDGIDGESSDVSHKNEIELLSWNWSMTQESSGVHSGSGGGSGKATVQDLSFIHVLDKASPNLMKYCLTGKHIKEARLTVRKAGGKPLDYLQITMNDVIVTEVNPGVAVGGERVEEQVSLAFARVKQEYQVQNAEGGSAGAITAGYDIKGNKEL
jgi:type VI secretion system secreted protein Hcp